MEEYLKQNDKIHCLQCNNENISFVSFPFGIFICENCSKEYNNFKKIQRLKNINEKFDPHEMNIIKLSGNERFLNLMKEYSISLTEPSIEFKYLTNISKYYIKLLKAETDKEEKKYNSEEEYNNILKEKPSIEDGKELDVDEDDDDDNEEELENFEKKLYEEKLKVNQEENKKETKVEIKKEEIKKEEIKKEENKKEEIKKEEYKNEIKKEENKKEENKNENKKEENKNENKIEEVEIKDKKTLLQQTKEDISNTGYMIGGWFSYLGSAIKNSADYMGITPKIQEAKTTFDNSMEKYGFNEMIQKTKDSIVNASISTANYIKETGKNIIENETLKNAFENVNKKYNEYIGKAEDYITKDNINQEKIREKINKDNNNPSDVVSQLKSDL